ncbi:MAG: nucleotidyltransferase domain-containing protein [Sulfuricella sp.]|nr:nucleotidyltransferase domain-containing protein [Sulfuricella sp.]
MRLTENEAGLIRLTVAECFGDGSRVRLFGSRADDAARGGDVDLYIQPIARDRLYARRIRCLARLTERLPYPVDVVLASPEDERPIDRVATSTGVEL